MIALVSCLEFYILDPTVKMRGFASGNELDPGFFIIMDRLYGTLNEKIATWKKEYSGVKGKLFGIGADKDSIQKLVLERMKVANDLAVAFSFMHSKKYVSRGKLYNLMNIPIPDIVLSLQ